MKPKPYFSILIPTLNEEKYLPALLTDLSSQTNQDFEVIVVDGHSDDNTIAQAKTFANRFPLSFINSRQRNVSLQRNLGAAKAKGVWLLFMDADNHLPPYFIQGLRYQIDKHQPDFFITHISPEGNHPLDKAIAQVINSFTTTKTNFKKPYLLESMLGIKPAIFQSVGGFNSKITWSEGSDLLIKLTRKNFHLTIFKEPKYVYSYRRVKKEGVLKILRNSAYLILAHQSGIPLNPATLKKYYPMAGGDFFNKNSTESNTLELIIIGLMKKYGLTEMIQKLNQPLILPQNPLTRLFAKLKRR